LMRDFGFRARSDPTEPSSLASLKELGEVVVSEALPRVSIAKRVMYTAPHRAATRVTTLHLRSLSHPVPQGPATRLTTVMLRWTNLH
jgi:hypothetical protein